MKVKKIALIFLSVLLSATAFSQKQWTFNTSTESWVLGNNLTGSIANGVFNMTITGSDPYLFSPDNLGINALTSPKIRIRLKNATTDTQFQLFWTTNASSGWDGAKSVVFTVNANDAGQRDYIIDLTGNTNWIGTIKQLRLDPGNNISSGTVLLDDIFIEKVSADFDLDNGIVHLKQDLTRGGAINYISKSTDTRNIVNTADEGRYVQQSYYAGNNLNRQSEGQSSKWSPWPWNPIQVGDYNRNRAQILESVKSGNSLYVKCVPMLWDMNNVNAEAYMEQWTTLEGNVIKVRNKLTCNRTDNIYGEGIPRDQELPAVYPISALSNLYSYFGNSPYTNDAISNPAVVNLSSGFWGTYNSVTEKWMAFVDNNSWGMGVYTPIAGKFLAGRSGKTGGEYSSSSTSYIAPTKVVALNKNSVLEYEYFLIIGTLAEIRDKVYLMHFNAVTSIPENIKENKKIHVYPNPSCDNISIDFPQNACIEIINIHGQTLFSKKLGIQKATIDISFLKTGLYFVRATTKDEVSVNQFIKESRM